CSSWATPSSVMTHHPGDLNVDHQITHRAVMTCFRPQPHPSAGPRVILAFEVRSSTGWYGVSSAPGFHPNYFTDISGTLELKLRALQAYSTEMRPWPHVRSVQAVEHLARFRGSMVGLEAAESFVMERFVQRDFES